MSLYKEYDLVRIREDLTKKNLVKVTGSNPLVKLKKTKKYVVKTVEKRVLENACIGKMAVTLLELHGVHGKFDSVFFEFVK